MYYGAILISWGEPSSTTRRYLAGSTQIGLDQAIILFA